MAGFEWVIAHKTSVLTHTHADPPKYEVVLNRFW